MKRRVLKLAEELGATVDVSVDSPLHGLYVQIDAPDGKHWSATGTNGLTFDMPDGRFRKKEWALALEDLGRGLIDCPEGGCEACGVGE